MKKTLSILAIGSGLALSSAQAEIESEFHVGYNSEYIFRGVDLGDDAFEFGLDFAGSCKCGLDWSAGIWYITPDGEDGNVDELDIYAAVSKDVGIGTVALGFTAYTFDNGGQDDSEVFLSATTGVQDIEATLTVFFGTDGVIQDQVLLEGSLGYSFAISDTVSANIGATYGYVLEETGAGGYSEDDGEVYASISFSLDVALSDEITFSPYVSYIEADEGNIDDSFTTQDGLIAGASLAFAF